MELKKNPITEDIRLKPKFVEHFKELLGDRYDEFLKYSFSYPNRSIRVNTLKTDVGQIVDNLESSWTLFRVPWCREGFWIEGERRDVGNLPEHMLGYIYIQEAASMIPPELLFAEPMKDGEIVLDMCASPGSKSSQIAAKMDGKGVLICNDIKGDRMKPLGMNLQRSGVYNAIQTRMYGHWFSRLRFDRILVDAPCSGTGTIRKSLKTLQIWNHTMIRRLAATQKKLLVSAYEALKPGGTLIYSTCSVEPEENEAVVDHLLRETDAAIEDVDIDIKRSDAITGFAGEKYSDDVRKCVRIYPQDNNTDGFFAARIRRWDHTR